MLKNIGYGEKSQRFSEEDYGKPLHSLADLERSGYWLVSAYFGLGVGIAFAILLVFAEGQAWSDLTPQSGVQAPDPCHSNLS